MTLSLDGGPDGKRKQWFAILRQRYIHDAREDVVHCVLKISSFIEADHPSFHGKSYVSFPFTKAL